MNPASSADRPQRQPSKSKSLEIMEGAAAAHDDGTTAVVAGCARPGQMPVPHARTCVPLLHNDCLHTLLAAGWGCARLWR